MPRIGDERHALSGPDSRALRCALGLERRHVTALANLLGLVGAGRCQLADVAAWETSGPTGYPHRLARILTALDDAVTALAEQSATSACAHDGPVVPLVRPPEGPKIQTTLALPDHGLLWSTEVVTGLSTDNGDFWRRLADAVVTCAVGLCHQQRRAVTVVWRLEP